MSLSGMSVDQFIEHLKSIQTIKDLPDGTKQAEPSEWALHAAKLLQGLEDRKKALDKEIKGYEDLRSRFEALFKNLSQDEVNKAHVQSASRAYAVAQKAEQDLAEALGRVTVLQEGIDTFITRSKSVQGSKRSRLRELAKRIESLGDLASASLPYWARTKIRGWQGAYDYEPEQIYKRKYAPDDYRKGRR